MKRFRLIREVDVSGVSGTGIVTEGVMFSDGTCAIRWLTKITSSALYNSVEDVIAIHGHEGATNIEWID
jgi:hypothetical protein